MRFFNYEIFRTDSLITNNRVYKLKKKLTIVIKKDRYEYSADIPFLWECLGKGDTSHEAFMELSREFIIFDSYGFLPLKFKHLIIQ